MIKYRELLRLYAQGVSQRGIASSCSNSRNTVSNVLKRGEHMELPGPLRKTCPMRNSRNFYSQNGALALVLEGYPTLSTSTLFANSQQELLELIIFQQC